MQWFIAPVIWDGDPARIRAVMEKAASGAPTTIGALGGSITEGAKATAPENRYINRIVQYWQSMFPGSDTTLVNAGIGATGSAIGAFRVADDLLRSRPDLVIVEYAVNDGIPPQGTDRTETYEAVVRACLAAGAAVLLLFLPRADGRDASADQRRVGAHYQVPMVSVVDAMAPHLADGSVRWDDYAADAVHPNDAGHALIAQHVCACLAGIRAAKSDGMAPIPLPLVGDRYDGGKSLGSNEIVPDEANGFAADPAAFRQFPDGWTARDAGASIEFRLTARVVQLLIRRSVAADAGYGEITLQTPYATRHFPVDARFPGGWGDYAMPICVLRADAAESVKVTLRCDGGTLALLRVQYAE